MLVSTRLQVVCLAAIAAALPTHSELESPSAPATALNVVLLGDSLINRPTEMFNLTLLLANLTEPPPKKP